MLSETINQLRTTNWQGERLSETVEFISADDQLEQFLAILDSIILPRMIVFRDTDDDFIAFTVSDGEILRVEHDPKISSGSSFMLLVILKDFASSGAAVEVMQFPVPLDALDGLAGTRVDDLRLPVAATEDA